MNPHFTRMGGRVLGIVGIQLTDKQRGELGSRLYHARVRANLTQKEMAKAIGVGVEAYSRWESGKVARPKQHLLKKAAKKLGVSTTWLLTGEDSLNTDALDELRGELRAMSAQLSALTAQINERQPD